MILKKSNLRAASHAPLKHFKLFAKTQCWGKLFERRYLHSDGRLVPSDRDPPATASSGLTSGPFAEVARRSLCSHASSHAIMNGCGIDHRSLSPRMKMKTAEEIKIAGLSLAGWMKCVRQITCSLWTGLEVACMLLFNSVILFRKLKLYLFFAALCPLH